MFIKNEQWMNAYETVIGKTHMKLELPNQDAVLSQVIDEDIMLSVVADGHGSSKCTRSHLGAQFAVEAAVETMTSIKDELIKNETLNTKVLGKYYTKRLVRNWRSRNVYNNTNYELHEVVKMATKTPANMLGLEGIGLIEEGYLADFSVFSENIDVEMTIVDGVVKLRRG